MYFPSLATGTCGEGGTEPLSEEITLWMINRPINAQQTKTTLVLLLQFEQPSNMLLGKDLA